MNTGAKIVKDGKVYHYFGRDGKELHDGDTIIYSNGREEKLYRTEDGKLGTDATSRAWIASGKAVPCEYGVYPLELSDLVEAQLKR